ncbi:TPA: hypothetical protein DEP94_00015 [Candidatus Nomurabacteria bacterium]|nr:hypothetical protein [Candidatus Nomurabacteria bacterium]
MIPANSIKQHTTLRDSNGNYRIYFVYEEGNGFNFECWDCRDGSSNCSRKVGEANLSQQEAIQTYEDHLKSWESN